MASIGYARVSTEDQNLDLQVDALERYGCTKIYKEKRSGVNANRPELEAAFSYLREGDELVVWKLDRLGRSMQDLIKLTNRLDEMGVAFVSLQDSIKTDDPAGRFFFHVMSALAEFEHSLIRQRTLAGLASAKERGVVGGRRPVDEKKLEAAMTLFDQGNQTVKEICNTVGISESTFYRYKRKKLVEGGGESPTAT